MRAREFTDKDLEEDAQAEEEEEPVRAMGVTVGTAPIAVSQALPHGSPPALTAQTEDIGAWSDSE